MCSGSHRRLDIPCQRLRHFGNQGGVDERLIPLHIDNNVVVVPTALRRHLGNPVGAAGMIAAREGDGVTLRLHNIGDAGIVGSDDNLHRPALAGRLGDAYHHRLAGNISERLAGQARRSVTRRDNDAKAHFSSPRHPVAALRLPA